MFFIERLTLKNHFMKQKANHIFNHHMKIVIVLNIMDNLQIITFVNKCQMDNKRTEINGWFNRVSVDGSSLNHLLTYFNCMQNKPSKMMILKAYTAFIVFKSFCLSATEKRLLTSEHVLLVTGDYRFTGNCTRTFRHIWSDKHKSSGRASVVTTEIEGRVPKHRVISVSTT